MVAGAAVTLVIGGTTYTLTQTDMVNNFSKDTGMSQQQATEYVENIKEEDLVSYDELGNGIISDSEELLRFAAEIDCANYQYEWETSALTCQDGKTQLTETGNDEKALGESYKRLAVDTASKGDMSTTINLIDEVNVDYDFPVIRATLEPEDIKEVKTTNSYNKALLQTALEEE